MQSLLELRHLKTLQALRDAGSLVRASQLLNLTQSALSHQLKALEEQYGAPLFERKSQPLRFTAPGERLLALANQVLPAVDEAERDISRQVQGVAGSLRIAVECHTCFDWLMPAMDIFRHRWPEVELDIVSGFHADPVGLIHQNRADLAIVSEHDTSETVDFHPLFQYEIVAIVANDSALAARNFVSAQDFIGQTLISYPVPDEMLDIMRQVLMPAGIKPARRSTELTVAMLQLVASGRGIAALPLWAVQNYLERRYVSAAKIGEQGLFGKLYATCSAETSQRPYLADFVQMTRESCFLTLPGIVLL